MDENEAKKLSYLQEAREAKSKQHRENVIRALELLEQGRKASEVAEELGVSTRTITRYKKQADK